MRFQWGWSEGFQILKISGKCSTVLHMLDAGTVYIEIVSTGPNPQNGYCNLWEEMSDLPGESIGPSCWRWSSTHRKGFFATFFVELRSILFQSWPVRRHNKLGITKREKIRSSGTREAGPPCERRLGCCSALKNRIRFQLLCLEAYIRSAFDLVQVFAPSIIWNLSLMVTVYIQRAHDSESNLIPPNVPTLMRPVGIDPTMYGTGESVYLFYRLTRNEDDPWRNYGTIISPKRHIVVVRIYKTRRQSHIAYEYITIQPRIRLVQDLSERTVEYFWEHRDEAESGDIASETDTSLTSPDTPQLTASTTLGSNALSPEEKYNGEYASSWHNPASPEGQVIPSYKQYVLDKLYDYIEPRLANASDLQLDSSWIINEVFKCEYVDNWRDAYTPSNEWDLTRDANVISSRFQIKVKKGKSTNLELNDSMVLHRHLDDEMDELYKHSISKDMVLTLLGVAIVFIINSPFRVAHISGAYMQSGTIGRNLYVRPPPKLRRLYRYLWTLTKLRYFIVDAGRQWLKSSDDWVICVARPHSSFHQMSYQLYSDGRVILVTLNTIDHFLIKGTLSVLREFLKSLNRKFDLRNAFISDKIQLNPGDMNLEE